MHTISGYEYGLMHFQFVNWENLLIKQAWYRCLERIRNPLLPIADINKKYAPSKNEDDISLSPCHEEWFEGYADFFDPNIYEEPESWRKKQVNEWFNQYGLAFFLGLDIWDVDWTNG